MKPETEEMMKLEQLYNVGFEWEMNAGLDSWFGWSIWTEHTGRGL